MTATLDRPWRLPEHSERCHFSRGQSSTRRIVRECARQAVWSVIESTYLVDGLEVGGVWGGVARTAQIEVCIASGPGPESERTKHTYRCDPAHDWSMIDGWRAEGYKPVGDWHVQDRDPEPSAADLSAWSKRRALLGPDHSRLCRYLAGIASEDRNGRWHVHLYVVRAGGGSGVDICESAGRVAL